VESGIFGWAWIAEVRVLSRLPVSGDLLCCGMLGDLLLLAFELGDRALLDVSLIQFLNVVRWFKKGGWYFLRRFGTKPLGCRRSGLVDTICSILLLDLRRSTDSPDSSFGGSGGRVDE
jgi:hypothetical protein